MCDRCELASHTKVAESPTHREFAVSVVPSWIPAALFDGDDAIRYVPEGKYKVLPIAATIAV